MDDRWANIDIVFRNGLKDYEVLPPADVWKNIYPAVRRRQRPFIFLRAAAMIAVVTTLSFLAYRWSAEISTGLINNFIVLDQESEAPSAGNQDKFLIAEADNRFAPDPVSEVPVSAELTENRMITFENASIPQINEYQSLVSDLSVDVKPAGMNPSLFTLMNNRSALSAEVYSPQYLPEIQPEKKTERWSIGALVSPTYYNNIKSGKNEFADQLLTDDQSLVSYSGGVALSYNVNKRFSVQSGLYYSNFGHELAGITAFSGFSDYNQVKGDRTFEVLTARGTIYTNNADIMLRDGVSGDRVLTRYTSDVFDPVKADLKYLGNSLHQSFSYLEMPLILRYKVIDKTIDFNIIGGLSSNLLVRNSVFASSDGGKYEVGETDGLSPLILSSSIGMGMEYSFSKNLSLNLEPTFRYYINSSSGIPGVNLHPYAFGIFSGFSYKF